MQPSSSELSKQFADKRPLHDSFTKSTETLLETLINAAGIQFFRIEGRTKNIESFNEKIAREGKEGKYNCLNDVTDISGIRVIAYLQEDCDRICSLIETRFMVDHSNSVRKEDELDPDKFGYLSTHYIISLASERIALPEYEHFASLKAEVQVRTLLQHTWAAIDWKFRYKEEREAPKELRRRLFRISALLEAADNEFSAVKEAIDKLAGEYTAKLNVDDFSIPIDTASLQIYLDDSKTVKSILSAARTAGLYLPSANIKKDTTGLLVKTAHIIGLETIQDLDMCLSKNSDEAKAFFKYILANRVRVRPDQKLTNFMIPASAIRYCILGGLTKDSFRKIEKRVAISPMFEDALKGYIEQKSIGNINS